MKLLHIEDTFCSRMGYQLNLLAKWNSIHGYKTYILSSNSFIPWMKNGFLNKDYSYKRDDYYYSKDNNVKIYRLKSYYRYSGREYIPFYYILNTINKIEPDGIIVHGLETVTGINTLMHYSKFKIPVIFDSHMIKTASINRYNKFFHAMFNHVFVPIIIKKSIKIVAVSEATKDYLMKYLKIPEKFIKVISLGTDTSIFYKNIEIKYKMLRKYGISNNKVIYIYTGKITNNKKVDLLINSFINANKVNKNIILFIIGSGNSDYLIEIKNKSEKYNNFIKFVPSMPFFKLNDFYNMADIAIWPGASSLSFFDAQAVGLPVILEDIDINKNRLCANNGFLFKQNSKDKLTKIIINTSLKDKNIVSLIGENGRKFVTKNHSYDNIAYTFEKLLFS